MAELLTVLSLSYWLCDDGCFCKASSDWRIMMVQSELFFVQNTCLAQAGAPSLLGRIKLKLYSIAATGCYNSKKITTYFTILLKDVMPQMMLYKIGLNYQ